LKRVCACAAVSLVLAFSATVFGAVSEGQFSVSPMIGGYTYDGGLHLKTAPLYSLKGGYSFTDHIGVEAGLDYSITSSKLVTNKDVAIFKYGVEGLYHFMPDKKLVPFVTAGLGGYNLSGPSALVSRKMMGFIDYGGGVKYFLYDRLALRADVRHVVANAGAFEYTLGVTIPFGGVTGETKPVPTFASVKAALEKKRREQVATPLPAPQEKPLQPAAAPQEENSPQEPSSSERLARMKEQFTKEELDRITAFKADWEKGKEARVAVEKSAREQEPLEQAAARNEQSPEKKWNATAAPAVKQTIGKSTTGPPKKSVLKKRRKAIHKEKHTYRQPGE
jgi:opacity protein-like surface antigen